MPIILGIESSCDDTAVAVYDNKQGLLAHVKSSQIATHQPYGGVVPELAARDHLSHITPLIDSCIEKARIKLNDLNAVAFTQGPGLSGALLVGASVGTSLAMGLGIPAIGVHHMEGHLLAPFLDEVKPEFPFTALLVSGGHTLLIDVKEYGKYSILGQTLDDALGEAFDKTAKMMGLGYPGGPVIEQYASQWLQDDADDYDGDEFIFSRPMINRPGLDFSFSGLKTQVRTTFENSDQTEQTKRHIAYAFQKAVVDTIVIKCQRALKVTEHNQLVIAGGVSANQYLREQIKSKIENKTNVQVLFPRLEFCTDNGAMIAYAGMQNYLKNQDNSYKSHDYSFNVKARWSLESIYE